MSIDREFNGKPNPHGFAGEYYTHYNINDDPDKCGFELVAGCEEPDMSYEFNSYIVLKDKETGVFYGAGDSGCSCPTPFENYRKLSELTRLRDLAHLEEELRAQYSSVLDPKYAYRDEKRGPMKDAIDECCGEARKAGLR